MKKLDAMVIVSAAQAWVAARSAFINLPIGSPDARRLLNELSNAEASLRAAVVADPPCMYCDDTGDVHRFDGEWLGYCDCAAGVELKGKGKPHE